MEIINGLKGLNNLGNTCYLNSILQCLINCPNLRELLNKEKIIGILVNNVKNKIKNYNIKKIKQILKNKNIEFKNDSYEDLFFLININDLEHIYDQIKKNENDKNYILEEVKNSLTFILSNFFENIWEDEKTIHNPKDIYKKIIELNKNWFMQQIDADEVLYKILDEMQYDLMHDININFSFIPKNYLKIIETMNELGDIEKFNLEFEYKDILELYNVYNILKINKNNFSLMDTLLFYLEISKLICTKCNYFSYNGEKNNHIITEIPNNDSNLNLEYCLDLYFNQEILNNDNLWFCNKCNKKVNATKQLFIFCPPSVLIIQLKRFDHTTFSKRSNLIKYPLNDLNLTKYMTEFAKNNINPIYDLFAVSCHIGICEGGHYYSIIKSLSNNNWYKIDDESINLIQDEDVITNHAFILFYKLRN